MTTVTITEAPLTIEDLLAAASGAPVKLPVGLMQTRISQSPAGGHCAAGPLAA